MVVTLGHDTPLYHNSMSVGVNLLHTIKFNAYAVYENSLSKVHCTHHNLVYNYSG